MRLTGGEHPFVRTLVRGERSFVPHCGTVPLLEAKLSTEKSTGISTDWVLTASPIFDLMGGPHKGGR